MSDRYDTEKEFHNEIYAEGRREVVYKYYSVTAGSRMWYDDRVLHECAGRRVLEYGCGTGSLAPRLAEAGADVAAIDISDTAIEMAQAKADDTPHAIDYRVMNAEFLDFPDNEFDLICGTAILHHLDLDKAMAEITRTLRPGGRAVFYEPLGHNPVVNAYRFLTPHLRTPDEHPLTMKDLAEIGKSFDEMTPRFFHMVGLATFPLRSLPGFKSLLRGADGLDQQIFSALPILRRYAWVVVLEGTIK